MLGINRRIFKMFIIVLLVQVFEIDIFCYNCGVENLCFCFYFINLDMGLEVIFIFLNFDIGLLLMVYLVYIYGYKF